MGTKTKIIVLHMKEIIYTAIFAALAILITVLLIFMFLPDRSKNTATTKKYNPGIYTSTVTLNSTDLEVEVAVDSYQINSIRISNLSEAVTTMYPMMQPAIEDLAQQIYLKQSLDQIELSEENPYTAQLLLNAIDEALKKAVVS